MRKRREKKIPKKGVRLCPIIELGTKDKWSIDFECPDFNDTNIIEFSFFGDNFPEKYIEINKSYKLLEGARQISTVVIKDIRGGIKE